MTAVDSSLSMDQDMVEVASILTAAASASSSSAEMERIMPIHSFEEAVPPHHQEEVHGLQVPQHQDPQPTSTIEANPAQQPKKMPPPRRNGGPRLSSICHHNKRRSQCVKCYDEGTGGSTICQHRRQRYACRKCFDDGQVTNSLCIHRTIKIKCKECTPSRPEVKHYRPRIRFEFVTPITDASTPPAADRASSVHSENSQTGADATGQLLSAGAQSSSDFLPIGNSDGSVVEAPNSAESLDAAPTAPSPAATGNGAEPACLRCGKTKRVALYGTTKKPLCKACQRYLQRTLPFNLTPSVVVSTTGSVPNSATSQDPATVSAQGSNVVVNLQTPTPQITPRPRQLRANNIKPESMIPTVLATFNKDGSTDNSPPLSPRNGKATPLVCASCGSFRMTGAVVDGYGRPLCSKCKTKAPDLSPSDGVAQTSRRRSRQSSSSSTRPSRSTASANSAPTNGSVRRSLRISQKRTADDAENGDSTESASEVEISSGKVPRGGRISPTNTQSTETTTESRHSHDNDDDDDDDDEVDQEFEEYRQRKQQEKMQRELPGEDVSRKRPRRGPHPAEEGEHGLVGHSTGVTSAPANNGVPVQQPGYSAIYTTGPAPGAGTPVPVPPSDGSTSQPYYLVWVPQNQTSTAGSDAGNQRRPSNGQEAAAQGMWYRMDAPPATYTGEHAPTVATAVPWSGPGTAQGAQGVSMPAYATVAVSHGVDPSRPPHNMHQQHFQPLSHHSQQMQHHFQTQSHHLQLLSASAPHQSHDGIHVGTEDESGEDSDEDDGQEGHEDVDQNTEVSHMAELRRGSSTRSPSGFTVDALAAAAAAAAMDEAEAAAAAEAASAAVGASTS